VYIFPNEGNLEDFFDALTAHSNHPCHEPHIYAGDFNAYTAEEIESHITPLDSHALSHRMGDTNPAHSPASPLTTATAPAADFRGRLLLNMLISIEFIITNGRFPSPSPNHRPYTFFQKPNTYSILDYNLIAKRHASLIRTCQVLLNVLPASVTDHMPMHMHLDMPTSSNLVPPTPPHTSPARTLYHSKRLKDPLSFADTANAALSEILQHVAHVVLGKVDPHTPKNEPDKSTTHHNDNHHFSQNPQEAYLQSTIQHHRNAIHTLKKGLSPDDPDTLTFHRDKFEEAQDALDKVRKLKNKKNYFPPSHRM